MKTKLKMAHEYAIALINSDCEMQFDKFIRLCWNYADAMQAEADKRENGEQSKHVFEAIDEWQPDWSQAPEWANWWAMDADRKSHWLSKEPYLNDSVGEWILRNNGEGLDNIFLPSLDYGYTGDWRESLRKRPQ